MVPINTRGTVSLVPASELIKMGIKPVGKKRYEPATGDIVKYQFGLADSSFMNETPAGRVIFGPDNVEPILGVTALESVGVIINPANLTLKLLPAIPLK